MFCRKLKLGNMRSARATDNWMIFGGVLFVYEIRSCSLTSHCYSWISQSKYAYNVAILENEFCC